ncbi:Aste57867_17118 [Aphanomyces stellatus]|uniref:Aste57867_17118 protein n=1 Tax=Aphanomyces stellatus TaxID=120398 RepID=A0A485L717_9STRA|nr:hypothetical protein As57867_017059 [Aphanomyces stellatus]VFT93876.1 Aste57867_17118 [Aphanomyces stellatus]
MRALYLVGFVFAAVALWAVTLTSSTSSASASFRDISVDQSQGVRSVDEKRAMAIAFVQKQLQENPAIPGLSFSVVYQNETVIATGFGTKQYGKTNTPVTAHSIFQIGSYTKTFIALGIGKLVDDGLVNWLDPVKQHLPWFRLMDKYAEQYTTLADLLAMNSVFGDHEGDIAWLLGAFSSERDLVERLAFFNTTRPFRAGDAYSNLNFVVLGQVIEHVTHQPWFSFLKTTYFDPLGMNETFGRPADVTNVDDVVSGHTSCNDQVLGPFDVSSSMAALPAGAGFIAAGSILSSATDLAKFSRFLLDHGRGILKSRKIIQDITTGHTILPSTGLDGVDAKGESFHPDGGVKGVSYGGGAVGALMYGYNFYDKNGGTLTMMMHNGFIPTEQLGVTLGVNVRWDSGADFYLLERMRSYVLGIFLDVPQATLDATWTQALAQFQRPQGLVCDVHFYGGQSWGNPIPNATQTLLAGTYVATTSSGYNGNLTVFKQGPDLMLHYGAFTKPLLGDKNDVSMLMWTIDYSASSMSFALSGLNTSAQTLTLGDVSFVRTA